MAASETNASLTRLAGAIKARWICEQAHQQLKEELGLDHFEGRSWTGLHRHALMTMIAYAFLQSCRLKQAKRKKRSSVGDLPTGPKTPSSTVLTIEEEALIVAFRRHTLLLLDECLYTLHRVITGGRIDAALNGGF